MLKEYKGDKGRPVLLRVFREIKGIKEIRGQGRKGDDTGAQGPKGEDGAQGPKDKGEVIQVALKEIKDRVVLLPVPKVLKEKGDKGTGAQGPKGEEKGWCPRP